MRVCKTHTIGASSGTAQRINCTQTVGNMECIQFSMQDSQCTATKLLLLAANEQIVYGRKQTESDLCAVGSRNENTHSHTKRQCEVQGSAAQEILCMNIRWRHENSIFFSYPHFFVFVVQLKILNEFHIPLPLSFILPLSTSSCRAVRLIFGLVHFGGTIYRNREAVKWKLKTKFASKNGKHHGKCDNNREKRNV